MAPSNEYVRQKLSEQSFPRGEGYCAFGDCSWIDIAGNGKVSPLHKFVDQFEAPIGELIREFKDSSKAHQPVQG